MGSLEKNKFSKPLDLDRVRITDEFWGREQELVRTEVIPYQWEALNDRIPEAAPSFCMRNFKVAGRLMREKREQGAGFVAPTYTFRGFEALPEDPEHPDPDKFYGFVFQDSDFAKWIEAVGYSLIRHPDPDLEKIADEAIDIVCAAQAENGYLDTYYIINGMDRIFTNLRDHHELYCFGHLVEGAVSYYQATGKDKLLRAAERYADFIDSKFGKEEGKCKGYPGHEIAEMALARLYELTGEERYLALAGFFLDRRGEQPYYFDLEEAERAAYEGRAYRAPKNSGNGMRYMYHQAHLPVRQQSEAVGHAVRGVYLYSGMADVARLTGDEEMYAACERLWDSITREKLYITGGIGGTHLGEAFSFPYDLPNDTAYSETCAAIGLVFFARRMLQIHADSKYADVMEQAVYNTVLAGMALDGKSFFYVNPLEVVPEACRKDERKRHVKSVRQKWFGCACCPPNIARLVSSLGAYVYTRKENTLYTHLYVGSRVKLDENVELKLESQFPWEGRVKATICVEESRQERWNGTFAFRIPGWCGYAEVRVRRKRQADAESMCGLTEYRISKGRDGRIDEFAVRKVIGENSDTVRQGGAGYPMDGKADAAYGAGKGNGEPAGKQEAVRQENEPRRIDAEGNGAKGISRQKAGFGEAGAQGNPARACVEKGYLYLTDEWQNGDEICLDFPMEVRYVSANTKVRQDIGKVALARGPVCYCLEEIDNGAELGLLRVDAKRLMGDGRQEYQEGAGNGSGNSAACVETSTALGHEMRILKVPGFRQESVYCDNALYHAYAPPAEKETILTFVPYYAWNNRGEGEMSVWVRV